MPDIGSFSIQIENFMARSNMKVKTVVKHVLKDIFRDLVLATPRVSGYARSKWDVGPAVPELDLSRGGQGPYPDPTARGHAAIQALPLAGRFPEGFVCYIYNNCRYISVLEHGSATQAPVAMVRTTLTRFQSYVAAAAASTGG